MNRVVCDTGPLISLEKITGSYAFIRILYDELLIPPAVLEELTQGAFETPEDYLRHYGIADLLNVEKPSSASRLEIQHLDRGEREAIALALERGLPLLIEEEAGRRAARGLGIPISGIAGQLLKAVRESTLPTDEAISKLTELRTAGRINRQIFNAVKVQIQQESS